MDTNEIVTNEEVLEATEEVAKASSGKAFRVAAGVGVTVLVGVIVYRYVAKPALVKLKARKGKCAKSECANGASEAVYDDWDEDI